MQVWPPPPHPRSEAVRPAHRPPPCDRECPLVTAGDRCLWHVGGTRPVGTMWFAPVGEGSPLAGRCGSARVTTVSLASCEAARQPVAGRITVSRAACSAALGGAHATTTPGSDNRERRGDQPSQRSLIFRGATGPDSAFRSLRARRATLIRATYLCIIVSTNYQSARFKG